MLLERLLVLKRLGAEFTFRFVNSRIEMLLKSLRATKRPTTLLTRCSVRRLFIEGRFFAMVRLGYLWATR
jgi:hypothetical protein